MKKLNLFIVFAIISLIHSNMNGQTTDYSNFLNGLVSAYSMEDSAALTDELGTNNGTVDGATTVVGNIGSALNFTGSQATMAVIPSSSSLDLDGTETSFMVDIYPTANGQGGKSVIVQKGWQSAGDNVYSVSYTSGNKIRFRNYINGVRRDFISGISAPLNTWSRIICVWKSGEPRIIRINTAADVEGTIFTGTQTVGPDKDVTIGSYDVLAPSVARSFVGRIDNVMIWNRALTTEEQNTLINDNLGFSDFTEPDPGVWSTDGSTAYYTDGNVAIGVNTVPSGYKMAIDGKLITEEVKVQLSGEWADYVFLKEYKLPTLQEVEKHIQENGHLINIPSAKEVKANGIELGEMNKLLLEKIEELTLYILEQGNKIQEQGKKMNILEHKINQLENGHKN